MSALPTHIGTRRVAELLGVCENSVIAYVDDGTIPDCFKTPGGHRRIPVQWVLDQLPPGEYDLIGKPRGFSAMTLPKRRSIASKGGKSRKKDAERSCET